MNRVFTSLGELLGKQHNVPENRGSELFHKHQIASQRDATLRFNVLSGVAAMIETVPLDQAAAAYAKMMAGKARLRMVLVTNNRAGQSAPQIEKV